MIRLKFCILTSCFQLFGFIATGQSIEVDNCVLFIESLKGNDTLFINSIALQERFKKTEKIKIFKMGTELVAKLDLDKRDTLCN